FLAWFAVVNSPLWPREAPADERKTGHDDKAHADKAHAERSPTEAAHDKAHADKDHGDGHHEPNALHHVMDEQKEWSGFMSFGPTHVPLPYLGHWPLLGDVWLSKFMILELIAALLICAIYIPLARKVQDGGVPR